MRKLTLILSAVFPLLLAGCGSPASDTPAAADESAMQAPAAAPMAEIDPMTAFGTTASNVFFYYEDVEAATSFYREILGLRVVADYGFAKIVQVAPKSFITLVDAAEGMHSADEPKTTAIALITDQLGEWWDYLQTQDVEMRSDAYTPKEGSAHDGFVAVDPEGYFLEFERFNAHPENEMLMPVLDAATTLYPEVGASNVPEGLGFKSTVIWFYYKDMAGIQAFYEDVLGFDLILDQGWAKVYQVGPSGYFGLVDEKLGMHNFTEEKAVTMSFFTDNIDGWWEYLNSRDEVEMRHAAIEDDDRYRAVVAYDPEGYFLEWDVFKDFPGNEALLEALAAP